MAIPKHVSERFDILTRAFANRDTAVIETTNKAGALVYLLVATQKSRGGMIDIIPFAQMIDGNPFDLYNPPALSDAPQAAATPAPAARPDPVPGGPAPADASSAAHAPDQTASPHGGPSAAGTT